MKKKRSHSTSNRRSKKQRKHPDKIIHTYGSHLSIKPADESTITMQGSIAAVESLLGYSFNNKRLLEEALTHSSCTDGLSYQRLEFLGDSVLALAISNFFFLKYGDVDAGILSRLRATNVSNEKLARVAVNHGLYKYIRHNKATDLNDKVWEFLIEVDEEEMVLYGGQMKAPKVLADVVESVAAAVYIDCGFNLHQMWAIFSHLLEPLVMLDVILAEPQPVTALYEACQKEGKQVDIQYHRNGDKTMANVFVDGIFIASRSSDSKENAKLHAAEAALLKITSSRSSDTGPQTVVNYDEALEIEGAKHKLHELCDKKKWQKPTYKLEQQLGPAHDRRYISSVKVELFDATLHATGNEKSKVKDAENSAASMMFCELRKFGYA